jgi:hypothetical protein
MVSDSPTLMLTTAGVGVTCLPLTVMSIRRPAVVEGEGIPSWRVVDDVMEGETDGVMDEAAEGAVDKSADGAVEEAGLVVEQDASATAAVSETTPVRGFCRWVNLVTVRSLRRAV